MCGFVSAHGLLGNGALRRYAPIRDAGEEVAFNLLPFGVVADRAAARHALPLLIPNNWHALPPFARPAAPTGHLRPHAPPCPSVSR